jgi:hypothetical protein
LCVGYGDRPIRWITPPLGQPCKRKDESTYSGDCAAGWVNQDTLEEFSMGL